MSRSVYAAAGVDIEAGQRAVALIREAVCSTHTPRVLAGVGAFGGLFDMAGLPEDAVLVASTDGVGTKTVLAMAWGQIETIGHDLVNHCVNDILVHGARPLFFLDYIASSRLDPEVVAQIVRGMSAACRAVGCALLGGETAEMPDVYAPGQWDVVGTVVGVVRRREMLPQGIAVGDVLLGLPSSGPHTNGYTLIRRLFADLPPETHFEGVGELREALLAPHRCYLPHIERLREAGVPIHGLVHITGGGLVDNLPRILPPGTSARVDDDAWPVPPLFRLIQERGQVSTTEMYRVFNMGIGMVVVLPPEAVPQAQDALEEPSWVIGEVVEAVGGER
jgi:phosphoribosylformylglycinamidine cyclo-ligase